MRSKRVWAVLGVLVFGLCSGLATAQTPQSQMYLVYDVTAKPSNEAKLYDALKDMAAFYAKYQFPYGWSVYASDDHHFYYLLPITGFADIGNFFETDAKIMAKAAAEYQELNTKFPGVCETAEFQVFTFRPELSSLPANPYFKPGETNFVFFDIWTIDVGKDQEAEKLYKEIMDVGKKKGIRDTIWCLAGTLGVRQPVYIFAVGDKDEIGFLNHNAEMWKLMGQEVDAAYSKAVAMCPKRESRRAWYQAELSYSPKK